LTLIQNWIAGGRQLWGPKPDAAPKAPKADPAGDAPKERVLGSYEGWSQVVGGILKAAGIPGFLGNLEQFYAISDIEGAGWRELVAAWWEEHKEAYVPTGTLFSIAESLDVFHLGTGSTRSRQTAFGMKLAKAQGRVIGSYRIMRGPTRQKVPHWYLQPASTA